MARNLQALTRGWHHHASGELDQAERAYHDVLDKDPDCSEAWLLLAALALTRQRPDDAAAICSQVFVAARSRAGGGAAGPLAAVSLLPMVVAPAEVIDKLTILEIKDERIQDEVKRQQVRDELALLQIACGWLLPDSPELAALTADLKRANVAVWDVEEIVRDCERAQDFGPRFIAAARTVYHENDRRARIKRTINDLLGSVIQEVKSHALEP